MHFARPSLLARVSVLLVVTGGARAVRVGHLRCRVVPQSVTMQPLGSSFRSADHHMGHSKRLSRFRFFPKEQEMSLQPTSTLDTVTITIEALTQTHVEAGVDGKLGELTVRLSD